MRLWLQLFIHNRCIQADVLICWINKTFQVLSPVSNCCQYQTVTVNAAIMCISFDCITALYFFLSFSFLLIIYLLLLFFFFSLFLFFIYCYFSFIFIFYELFIVISFSLFSCYYLSLFIVIVFFPSLLLLLFFFCKVLIMRKRLNKIKA